MVNIPRLRINEVIATNGISVRIELGEEIREQLSKVEAISNQDKFQSILNEFQTWSAQNLALLKQYYNDDWIPTEYQRIDVPIIDREEQSLTDNKRHLRKAVEERIDWLKKLL